jgi:hypothetical protein
MENEQLIIIYFSINIFIAGYNLARDLDFRTNFSQKFFYTTKCIFTILFAIPSYIVLIIADLIATFLGWINGYFQVSFYFSFYLTNKWDKLKKHELERINNISKNVKNTNSLRDRLYRRGTKLINERYNKNNNEK